MRAVNLIPVDERRGAGGAAGRSGGAAYLMLGLLAVLVVIVSFYAVEKRSVSDKRADLTRISTEATTTEARAASLASFTQFAGVRAARTATVTSLAASRFDWSHALHEIARVIPPNVSLTTLRGTVAPGVTTKGGNASASSLRGALAVPAIELSGCTADQDSVARMITRLRLIDGVIRVSLQSSVKAATATGTPGAAGCSIGKSGSPQFALVVFFDQVAGAVPTKAPGSKRVTVSNFAPSGATPATPQPGVTP